MPEINDKPPQHPHIATGAGTSGTAIHIPELDGVRGLAILLVLIHHFFSISYPSSMLDWAVAYGVRPLWIGVDLFFVLSGFLITRILVETSGKPRYFRNFYARRSLRIFPLYYVSLILFLVVCPLLPWGGFDAYREVTGQQRGWLFLYLINYFTPTVGTLGNLSHFWSLCVEEHFYLIWPVLVWLAPKRVLPVALIGIGVVIGIRMYATMANWPESWYYHATHARIDSLMMGAVASQLYDRIRMPIRRLRIAIWSLMVATGLVFFIAGLRWNVRGEGLGSLVAMAPLNVMWACFLLLVLWKGFHPRISNLFRSHWLTVAGKYSYGHYVFHWPALYLSTIFLYGSPQAPRGDFGRFPSTMAAALLATIVTLTLAYLSWNLLEKRCLALKHHFDR